MKNYILLIIAFVFMINSTLKSYDKDPSFKGFINSFQTIELPYKIDVIMMKELIKKYSQLDKRHDSLKLNNKILKKAFAKLLKINPKKLNPFPTYYPIGKFSIDSLMFTLVFHLGEEYGGSEGEEYGDSDVPSYSIVIELFIFDKQAVFIEHIGISRYLDSIFPIFSEEAEFDTKGNLKITTKLYSEIVLNKVIEQDTDNFIFNKETKEFERIDKK